MEKGSQKILRKEAEFNEMGNSLVKGGVLLFALFFSLIAKIIEYIPRTSLVY